MKPISYYWWNFVHNALIHPLLALPWEAPEWVVRAHDWTAAQCWPDDAAKHNKEPLKSHSRIVTAAAIFCKTFIVLFIVLWAEISFLHGALVSFSLSDFLTRLFIVVVAFASAIITKAYLDGL